MSGEQLKKPRIAEASQRAAQFAQCIAAAMNLAGFLASPHVMRQIGAKLSREHVLEHLNGFQSIIDGESTATFGDGRRLQEMGPHVDRLRALCESWTPSADVPSEIQRAARDLLAAFGIPEPAEGWDRFEGEAEAEQ